MAQLHLNNTSVPSNQYNSHRLESLMPIEAARRPSTDCLPLQLKDVEEGLQEAVIESAIMAHNYNVGTKAWQPDATEGWVASEVTSKNSDGTKVSLVFSLANGEVSCEEPGSECICANERLSG